MQLLPKESAPGPQYRNNNFIFLIRTIGNNFGYEHQNYHPELEGAIDKMTSWWEKNQSTFNLSSDIQFESEEVITKADNQWLTYVDKKRGFRSTCR